MDRLRPLLAAARPELALLAPFAVFVGSSYARFDAQPGPGIPAHLLVSVAALFAALGVNLVDHAWDAWGAPPPDPRRPDPEAEGRVDSRDATIAGVGCLVAAALFGAALVPLSGDALLGYGGLAIALGVLRGAPLAGLDTLGRGLGDLANVAALGPLAALVGFASQAGEGSAGAAMAGIPAGLAAAAVLYTRHFTRPDADLRHERATPVAVLGEAKARLGLVALPVVAILAAVLMVQAGEAPRGTLVAALPLAALAAYAWRLPQGAGVAAMASFARHAAALALTAILALAIAFRLAAPA